MTMQRTELYKDGLVSLEEQNLSLGPPWASDAGWDGVGVWITILPADLARAIPSLRLSSVHSVKPFIQIASAPKSMILLSKFFDMLEDKYFNLAASLKELTVTCEGATLSFSSQHGTYFTGVFNMLLKIGEVTHKVRLPRRMVLSNRITDVQFPGEVSSIVYFEVKGKLVMSSSDFSDFLWETSDLAASQEQSFYSEMKEGTQPPQARRKSKLLSFFLKKE